MKIEILTHADVLRHTSARVLIAVCSTLFLTAVMIAIMFGSDPETNIRLGEVARYDITIGAVIAASLTSGLAYRSGLLMQQLSLARAELRLRASITEVGREYVVAPVREVLNAYAQAREALTAVRS